MFAIPVTVTSPPDVEVVTLNRMHITKTYFMVPVHDMDRATTFYRDVIGLEVGFQSPYWSELSWRDATIALHLGGEAQQRAPWLGFNVDDLDAAAAEIEAAGGTRGQERIEGGSRLLATTDTEGNGLTIGQQL
jgi:predicted enzyme related to lactoylglutathione lyase